LVQFLFFNNVKRPWAVILNTEIEK
jgi:hypothetical protein